MEQNQNFNDEIEIDLLELLQVLWSKALIILMCTIIAAMATGLTSKFLIQPVYSSTTKLYVLSKSTSLTSFADIQIGTSLTQDYMELIESRPVVEAVIENLNLDLRYEEMLEKMTVENPSNTRIISITIQDNDAVIAKEIADEFAVVSISRISEVMETDEPNVVEEGHVAELPISPNTLKNTVIGAAVGFFLACAVVITLHLMDDTIKSSDDLERYLGLNTLALIPKGKEEYDGRLEKKKWYQRKSKKGSRK